MVLYAAPASAPASNQMSKRSLAQRSEEDAHNLPPHVSGALGTCARSTATAILNAGNPTRAPNPHAPAAAMQTPASAVCVPQHALQNIRQPVWQLDERSDTKRSSPSGRTTTALRRPGAQFSARATERRRHFASGTADCAFAHRPPKSCVQVRTLRNP